MVKITREFLRRHSKVIFVFGDNLVHKGYGGAAELRDEANTYGFITKKYPDNKDSSFYGPDKYREVFALEIAKLIKIIDTNPRKLFLISKIGSGLANRYHIWEKVIEPQIVEALKSFSNVIFLWHTDIKEEISRMPYCNTCKHWIYRGGDALDHRLLKHDVVMKDY